MISVESKHISREAGVRETGGGGGGGWEGGWIAGPVLQETVNTHVVISQTQTESRGKISCELL